MHVDKTIHVVNADSTTYQVFWFIDVDPADNCERLLRLVIEGPRFIHLGFQPIPDASMFPLK